MNRPHLLTALASALMLLAIAPSTLAQGVLVDVRVEQPIRLPRPIVLHRHIPQPPPTASYKIDSLEVNAKLTDQIARVQVSQTFENTGSVPMEVCFMFPLPYDGAIDQLTLLVDGKEYEAKLLSKEEARRRYEEIVRKNRDPALLEWVGTGMFQTSVFPIPPGAKRTVTLRYSQLLRKNYGLTDFIFPLSTAKYTCEPLEKLSIRLAIESGEPIKNVYSATHTVDIERPDKTHAVVKYEAKKIVPGEDFRLFFDSGEEGIGASVVSYRPKSDEDGYFLLLASPQVKAEDDETVAKTVVFVVDRSGSMSGEKIEQAKGAAKFVLNNLRKGDMFNIVAYDSEIETFRPELEKFNDELASRGARIRRRPVCRRQHRHRRRAEAGARHARRQQAAHLRVVSHRRPAHGRRNRRIGHRQAQRRTKRRAGPRCSPSASATTSTAGCSTSWPAPTSASASTCVPTKISRHRSPRSIARSARP